MTKTQGQSSITISKLAFLDEMLPEPWLLREERSDYNDATTYSLEDTDKLLELIKKLAAKVLTEDELVNILGNQSRLGRYKATYAPNPQDGKPEYSIRDGWKQKLLPTTVTP